MKYVCPQNLYHEHDKACKKVIEKELEKEIRENTPKFLSKEQCYLLSKGRFFGLSFSEGLIRVKVIESVKEMTHPGGGRPRGSNPGWAWQRRNRRRW